MRNVLVLAAAGCASILLATDLHRAVAESAESPATSKAGAPHGVAALGRIEPQNGLIRIAASSTPDAVSGAVLTRLLVDRGTDVKAGQLIAELDTAATARAQLNAARADLETARREAVAAASQADEACVQADVAAKRAKRQQDLLKRNLTSTEQADIATGDAEAGAASCKARRASASVAQARIDSIAAGVARYEAELERSLVRAPFAGRIVDVLKRPGEIVGQDGIVELARIDHMQAIAEVFEGDIGRVRVGQHAVVRSDALAQPLTGTVARIRPKVQKLDLIGDDPVARKDGRIVEVEVDLDDGRAVENLTNLQVDVEIGR